MANSLDPRASDAESKLQALLPEVTALRERAAAAAQINRDLTSQRTQLNQQLALCTARTAANNAAFAAALRVTQQLPHHAPRYPSLAQHLSQQQQHLFQQRPRSGVQAMQQGRRSVVNRRASNLSHASAPNLPTHRPLLQQQQQQQRDRDFSEILNGGGNNDSSVVGGAAVDGARSRQGMLTWQAAAQAWQTASQGYMAQGAMGAAQSVPTASAVSWQDHAGSILAMQQQQQRTGNEKRSCVEMNGGSQTWREAFEVVQERSASGKFTRRPLFSSSQLTTMQREGGRSSSLPHDPCHQWDQLLINNNTFPSNTHPAQLPSWPLTNSSVPLHTASHPASPFWRAANTSGDIAALLGAAARGTNGHGYNTSSSLFTDALLRAASAGNRGASVPYSTALPVSSGAAPLSAHLPPYATRADPINAPAAPYSELGALYSADAAQQGGAGDGQMSKSSSKGRVIARRTLAAAAFSNAFIGVGNRTQLSNSLPGTLQSTSLFNGRDSGRDFNRDIGRDPSRGPGSGGAVAGSGGMYAPHHNGEGGNIALSAAVVQRYMSSGRLDETVASLESLLEESEPPVEREQSPRGALHHTTLDNVYGDARPAPHERESAGLDGVYAAPTRAMPTRSAARDFDADGGMAAADGRTTAHLGVGGFSGPASSAGVPVGTCVAPVGGQLSQLHAQVGAAAAADNDGSMDRAQQQRAEADALMPGILRSANRTVFGGAADTCVTTVASGDALPRQQCHLKACASTGRIAHAAAPGTVARRESSEAGQLLWEGMVASVRSAGNMLADLEKAHQTLRDNYVDDAAAMLLCTHSDSRGAAARKPWAPLKHRASDAGGAGWPSVAPGSSGSNSLYARSQSANSNLSAYVRSHSAGSATLGPMGTARSLGGSLHGGSQTVQGSMLRASLSQSSSGLHSVREDRTVSRDRAGGAVFGGQRLGMAFEEVACWGGKIEEDDSQMEQGGNALENVMDPRDCHDSFMLDGEDVLASSDFLDGLAN